MPLRNRNEILMGEILTTILSDTGNEDRFLIRLRTIYSNNFCPNAADIERLNSINSLCTHHRHITVPQIPRHQSLCKYCREEVDVLLVVYPAGQIDPETAELLAIAQQKQIPILHYNPETFEIIRENLPDKWITYTDTITESDVDDFFSENA